MTFLLIFLVSCQGSPFNPSHSCAVIEIVYRGTRQGSVNVVSYTSSGQPIAAAQGWELQRVLQWVYNSSVSGEICWLPKGGNPQGISLYAFIDAAGDGFACCPNGVTPRSGGQVPLDHAGRCYATPQCYVDGAVLNDGGCAGTRTCSVADPSDPYGERLASEGPVPDRVVLEIRDPN